MLTSLVCLIGLPGAGKSTLCRTLVSHFSGSDANLIVDHIEFDVVTPDEVYSRGRWKKWRQCFLKSIENNLNTVANNLNRVILLDDNFYYRSMRFEIYRMAKRNHCAFIQIFINTPVEICLLNNKSRQWPKQVSDNTLISMSVSLEPPNPLKNPWETLSLEVNNTDAETVLGAIQQIFSASFNSPLLSSTEASTSNGREDYAPQTVIHTADLSLRKIVSSIISTLPPTDERKSIAKSLIDIKKDLLQSIKCKEIILPEIHGDMLTTYEEILRPYMNLHDHLHRHN